MKQVLTALISVAILGLPQIAQADMAKSYRGQDRASSYMRVFGPTLPPYGFVRFCETHSKECQQGPMAEMRFDASRARLQQLDDINRHVNKLIEPTTDLDLYGEVERWTIPTTKGDCEDYALLKRQMLIARGWPVSSLLMTVVRDEKNEGHAVLTARTAQGDFVLDNKSEEIRPWHKVGYAYVMRQSYIDPKVWVSLDPKDATSPALLSGVKGSR